MSGALEALPSDLSRFSGTDAVKFFSKLIWAEASRLGIAKNLIDIPSAIHQRDGGIDTIISGAATSLICTTCGGIN